MIKIPTMRPAQAAAGKLFEELLVLSMMKARFRSSLPLLYCRCESEFLGMSTKGRLCREITAGLCNGLGSIVENRTDICSGGRLSYLGNDKT